MSTKWLAAVLLLGGVIAAAPAYAADGVKIGFVDMRQVILESNPGRAHQADMERFIKEHQAPLDKEKDKLQAMRDNFEKERLTLTDAQKAAKQKQFEAELQKYQAMAGQAQAALRDKDNRYMQRSISAIRVIIAKVAHRDHLSLVFEKTQLMVLYSEPGMDITQQVMQMYNAQSGSAAK